MGLNDCLIGGVLLASVAVGSTTPTVQEAVLHSFRDGTHLVGSAAEGRQLPTPHMRSLGECLGCETGDARTRLTRSMLLTGTRTGEHLGPLLIVAGADTHSVKKAREAISSSHDTEVVQSPQAQAIAWMLQATKLSRKRIGELIGVSRQGIHAWEGDGEISVDHLEHLLAVQDVLRRAQRNHLTSGHLQAWLVGHPVEAEESPANLLRRGEFDRARMLAVLSSQPGLEPIPAWVGERTVQRWQESGEPLDESYPESEPELPPAFRGSWDE